MKKLKEIQKLADEYGYRFSFQFWGEGNNNVFIYKEPHMDIDIYSGGSFETPEESMKMALNWIKSKLR